MTATPNPQTRSASPDAAPSRAGRLAAIAVVGTALVGSGLAACSQTAVPADDEYAGRASRATASSSGDPAYWASDADESGDHSGDGISGPYPNGTYSASERYGPVKEDAVHVTLTVADGVITDATVTGDALLPQSARFQSDFVAAIRGVVEGRVIDDAHIDVVAGASKTSATFNKALDAIRRQASEAATPKG